MGKGGTVGEAHRLDAVVVVDHRFGDGDAVVGAGEFKNQRPAIGTLIYSQIAS